MTEGGDQGPPGAGRVAAGILTPDQRVRVFVSSTLEELADERAAVRTAIEGLHLAPVLFELGARAHPPRTLYRSYLEQSHVFVGIYWERYGWVAPSMDVSGLEDEYLLAGDKPKLMYVKHPAPGREPRLAALLARIRDDGAAAYKAFSDAEELRALVADDLSLLLSEAFLVDAAAGPPTRPRLTLPAEATRFIGRDAELAELDALLSRDDVRLVTLTGPGGIGKTRLALRAATRAAPAFEEGAAFVPLAAVSDDRPVVGAIASAVGLPDRSGVDVPGLAADLSDRSLLLVLDNFEHVMGAAELVPRILATCPEVKVLATSREALRLHAEHDVPVPPLSNPDAAAMLVERATAVRGDRSLDEADPAVIARIARRLEGVPLAIELAAARLRLLSPEALLARLDDRLDVLVGGPRDLPARQRTLRSTIEWSYDLLDPQERRVFDGLGAFVGSFPLAAVEAIVPAVDVEPRDALDLLASLVDKSLLRVEPTAGEPRFRMLDMLAEFARERLAESGDLDAVGERHAAFYRDLSREIGRGLVSGDQERWLAVLGDDHDGETGNIRAALSWYLSHGRGEDIDDVADMAWSLWVPAWINGRVEEGRRVAGVALDAGDGASDRSRARLLIVLGIFEMWSGDHETARQVLDEGSAIARALDDDEVEVASLLGQSMLAGPREGEDRAAELADQAATTFRRLGDARGEAAALNVLGWVLVAQERFDGSGALLERTLAASVAARDEQFCALAEVNLAELRLHDGDLDGATALLASSARRHRAVRLPYSIAYLLDATSRVAAARADWDRAARLLGAAAARRSDAGVSVWGSQAERLERFRDEVTAELGHEGFDTQVATGSALSYDESLRESGLVA
jgi:predicted ATPase